jgi:hypothetical protein
MPTSLSKAHPLRIFAISTLITLACLIGVSVKGGGQALFLTFVLILVELMFSFDNAIINARILATMSRFWQQMFMTVGILLAVFLIRFAFPIVLVMVTAGLSAASVFDLALNHPDAYAATLVKAHPYIASFGGMFLLMLSLSFFFDPGRKVLWINVIERPLQRIGKWWLYTGICVVTLLAIGTPAWNPHPRETLLAGGIGIGVFLLLHAVTELFGRHQAAGRVKMKTGLAGFIAFAYLQVLDSSFSFDGVIGAFAITNDVFLIAIGLGIGALWVRSLTLLMVRRNTLNVYRYLEHGAHYTIGVLAAFLLVGLFVEIPEAVAGGAGLLIVGASIISSIGAARRRSKRF